MVKVQATIVGGNADCQMVFARRETTFDPQLKLSIHALIRNLTHETHLTCLGSTHLLLHWNEIVKHFV